MDEGGGREQLVLRRERARRITWCGVLWLISIPFVVVGSAVIALRAPGIAAELALSGALSYAPIAAIFGALRLVEGIGDGRELDRQLREYDEHRHLPRARLLR